MNLRELKKVLNNIPKEYDDIEVNFICNSKVHVVKDVDNDIEWYSDDMNNDKLMVDIWLT